MADKKKDIEIAFDVGHSSIGWAVLNLTGEEDKQVELAGCGTVIFRADDCLASSRRAYRRQRRHIRSTRQRIERLKIYLESLGVLTRAELDKAGCAWPWKLAAKVLSSKSGTNKDLLLSWPELWDVLRWYAHNRGYDGNRRWSANEEEDEDTEKVQNANALMENFKTRSMAETVCAVSGIDPLGTKNSCNVSPADRFKAKNAAFPRDVVEGEVREIIRRHFGVLKGVDEGFERVLMEDWSGSEGSGIKLAKRYRGGLLFGQLVPRFENRIISTCPVSGNKVPNKQSREFYHFRWAMQMANVRVAKRGEPLRMLTIEEIRRLDQRGKEEGSFTEKEFKEAVREITGCERDNLETMLMHPEAKKALVADPVQAELTKGNFKKLFPLVSEAVQRRARGKLWRLKSVSLKEVRGWEEEISGDAARFDAELERILDAAGTRRTKKENQPTRESVLSDTARLKPLSGRAAFSRELLKQAYAEVLNGKHPKEEGGCLYVTEDMRKAAVNRRIEEQTNNHLVRHRLVLLERLLKDVVKEHAGGEKSRVAQVTIEVNRDLKEMSGKTAKEIKQDLGLRLANHGAVSAKLEKALGDAHKITAGLIRKARIAEDLGWKCPYTGKAFDVMDLLHKHVDKDHVVPRSLRPSDSLSSLVVTYNEVNAWKGKRTALQFIKEEGGKPVPGVPNLSIMPLAKYKEFVEKLEAFKGHDDDKRRKETRKKLLVIEKYEEKEFTPRDLTVTSHLVRLGAQTVQRVFSDCEQPPKVVSLPGSVTGTVRKAWEVLGCLALANPGVLDEQGKVRPKGEIRDITHLHHALDACVLAFAAHFIPNNGRVWELLLKRALRPDELAELRRLRIVTAGDDGRFEVRDLRDEYKEEIRQRLAERRVVQHVPARMTGLRVEQNVWRVLKQDENGEVTICQSRRGPDGKRQENITTEKAGKLLGLEPEGGNGKLKRHKGVLVIPDNFGVALDPHPTVIPFHKVPNRLRALREENHNRPVRILRNGQLFAVKNGGEEEVYKVLSIANKKGGIVLKYGNPDLVRRIEKPINYRESTLKGLLKSGFRILQAPYTGAKG